VTAQSEALNANNVLWDDWTKWRLPPSVEGELPLFFSLLASRPPRD
jgi:hypothetical protein